MGATGLGHGSGSVAASSGVDLLGFVGITLTRPHKPQKVLEFISSRASRVDQDSTVVEHDSDLDLASELMHDRPEHIE